MYTKISQNKLMSTNHALAFVFLMSFSSISFASVYVAQTAQGTQDGSSCANARAASWFNTSGNWGSGATQIGAGQTVFLCGSISTNLTFQGSGTTNSYITVDGKGATYSGEFNTANQSWWKVQNVTYADGAANLITISGGSNGIFTGNYADNTWGGVFVAQYGGTTLPNNITISNNFIRTTTADCGTSCQIDIIATEGSTNVILEGNYLEMRTGGSGGGSQHDDCIQTWQKGGTNGGPPSNWTIRYNKIVMNSSSANDRSWTMLENLGGTINIYDNVFLGLNGASSANGLNANSSQSGVIFNIFNNTFVAKGSASNNVLNLTSPGTANIRNNIFHTIGQTALTGSMATVRDHNLWYGSNIPSCSGYTGELCNINPMFADYANNDFSLQSSSPAINAGSNLGSSYNSYIIAGSSWPTPTLAQRPASGNWALGAYEYAGSSTPLLAPSNLRILP